MADLEHAEFRVHRAADRLAVSGPVSEATVDSLREILGRYDSSRHLIVDLSGVTYLASPGISVLVTTHLRFRDGGGLTLIARESSIAHQLLDICGIPHEVE